MTQVNEFHPAAAELTLPPIALHPENIIPQQKDGIHAIIDLTQKAGFVGVINVSTEGLGYGLPNVVPLLKNDRTGTLDIIQTQLEAYRQAPKSRKGVATTTTLDSFIELTNRHKDDGSVVFAQTTWPNPHLTSVIDYHDLENKPRFSQHRIQYKFPITPELETWITLNQKPLPQDEFAIFLEDHAADLASPTQEEKTEFEGIFKERFAEPNELIGLSRSLEISVSFKVKQGLRLQSGERVLEFSEEHHTGAGEKVTIPGLFIVSIAPFMDSPPVRMITRLKYRLISGKVVWVYQLYRWELVLRARIQGDILEVGRATELPCFEGSPEA